MRLRDWLRRLTGGAKIQLIHERVRESDEVAARRRRELMARALAAEEKAWWKDLTGLVGPTDERLAVIGPSSDATPDDLRALGKELERWKAEFPQARHIWGLADMLEGRRPRTPPIYLELPFPGERYEECYEPVALVYVVHGTDMDAAARNLSERFITYQNKLSCFDDPEMYIHYQR